MFDAWWREMEHAGLTVRFYTDTYRRLPVAAKHELSDQPTPFGGHVVCKGEVLAVVCLDPEETNGRHVKCLVCPMEAGLPILYMLIASGLRNPCLPANAINENEIAGFMGGVFGIYVTDDDLLPRIAIQSLAGLSGEIEEVAPKPLPETFRAFGVRIGESGMIKRAGFVHVISGPMFVAHGLQRCRFVALRSVSWHKDNAEYLLTLNRMLQEKGARLVNVNER
jgi:hypothetical protein